MLLNIGNPSLFIFFLVALLTAITIHEFFHAFVTDFLGDPTPRLAGRLTLNPLAHLDFLGTIMLLIAGFGWGKPVPYNPYFLKKGGKFAPVLIAFAGPFSNFCLAFILSVFYRILYFYLGENIFIQGLYLIIQVNIILMVFNLLPIPPLDGSKIFYLLPKINYEIIHTLEYLGIFLLFGFILLGGFNLVLPIINWILSNLLKVG